MSTTKTPKFPSVEGGAGHYTGRGTSFNQNRKPGAGSPPKGSGKDK